MAKEKPTDPDKAARKAAKADKKSKRSETDGVHKSSSASKKDSKNEKATPAAAAADAENIDATTKLLNKLADEAPGTVVVKDAKTGEVEMKAKTAPILGALVPFAHPLAEEKVCKKVLKSVKKAAKTKNLKRGVKEVVKSLRKSAPHTTGGSTTGVVILAADISPMDVISHIPVLCEDHGVPYIFVPSRAELGAAGSTKRPTSVVMVGKDGGGKGGKDGEEDWSEVFGDLVKVVVKAGRDVKV